MPHCHIILCFYIYPLYCQCSYPTFKTNSKWVVFASAGLCWINHPVNPLGQTGALSRLTKRSLPSCHQLCRKCTVTHPKERQPISNSLYAFSSTLVSLRLYAKLHGTVSSHRTAPVLCIVSLEGEESASADTYGDSGKHIFMVSAGSSRSYQQLSSWRCNDLRSNLYWSSLLGRTREWTSQSTLGHGMQTVTLTVNMLPSNNCCYKTGFVLVPH